MSLLTILFIVYAVCHFFDTKLGRPCNMEDKIRKKYRKFVSIAYLLLALITFGIFMAELIYHIKFGFLKCMAVYMIPILYMVYINKRFHIH